MAGPPATGTNGLVVDEASYDKAEIGLRFKGRIGVNESVTGARA